MVGRESYLYAVETAPGGNRAADADDMLDIVDSRLS